MNRTSFILAGLLALSGVAANAESPDPSGQFAQSSVSSSTRAAVVADLQANREQAAAMTGEDSGSSYLAQRFQSTKTRAEIRNEFLAHRAEVAAMTGEDSGSTYLATRKMPTEGNRLAAGQAAKSE